MYFHLNLNRLNIKFFDQIITLSARVNLHSKPKLFIKDKYIFIGKRYNAEQSIKN